MRPLLRHAETATSTNDVVAGWIRDGATDGVGLFVDAQTGGRGRRGRTWVSPPGENLALSVAIVGPKYRQAMLQLPLAAAVGAAEAVAALGVDVGLKWPNDLLVDGRKLGGILCEAVMDGSRFVGAVVGIGINMNTPAARLPDELRATSASLIDLRGETDVHELAAAVRARIHAAARRLAGGERADVLADWAARDATRGRRVRGDTVHGVAAGIDGDGMLLVRRDDGSTATVSAGEVLFE